jgi:hypothetical protein
MSSSLVLSELIQDKKELENNIENNIRNIDFYYKKLNQYSLHIDYYNDCINLKSRHETLLKNNYNKLNIINAKLDNYNKDI